MRSGSKPTKGSTAPPSKLLHIAKCPLPPLGCVSVVEAFLEIPNATFVFPLLVLSQLLQLGVDWVGLRNHER